MLARGGYRSMVGLCHKKLPRFRLPVLHGFSTTSFHASGVYLVYCHLRRHYCLAYIAYCRVPDVSSPCLFDWLLDFVAGEVSRLIAYIVLD